MNKNTFFALTNPIQKITGKSKYEWDVNDIIKVILQKEIEKITFHYTGWDGKIKDLRIPITNYEQAIHILTDGERVDGSSLFKGVVDMGKSDLYVVPSYKTAFINPFDCKSLDFICRFFDKDGNLANFTPDNILLKIANDLQEQIGLRLYALGELEFYLIQEPKTNLYRLQPQSGYHSSSPYVKSSAILEEIVNAISKTAGNIKYAHYEVGAIDKIVSDYEQLNDKIAEQVEVEFSLTPIEEAADIAVISKWMIHNIAARHNAMATFYPKLEIGHAGSGLHFHLALMKDGKNIMIEQDGSLSSEAKTLIGGLVKFAPSLTAFGNLVSGSYLRLVPHQEAPTKVCWSEMNRSAMIRVPLAWGNTGKLSDTINPKQSDEFEQQVHQTVELRSPDGSANVHLLLAGISQSAKWAFKHKDEAMQLTEKHHITGNISDNPEYNHLPEIAESCDNSANVVIAEKDLFLCDNSFPEKVITKTYELLKAENDSNLNSFLANLPEEERRKTLRNIIHKEIINRNI